MSRTTGCRIGASASSGIRFHRGRFVTLVDPDCDSGAAVARSNSGEYIWDIGSAAPGHSGRVAAHATERGMARCQFSRTSDSFASCVPFASWIDVTKHHKVTGFWSGAP